MLVEQVRHFGPFKESFRETAGPERLQFCLAAVTYIHENNKWLQFRLCGDKELTQLDIDFIAKMMKLDPRDRPTAKELLQDAYFKP